MLLPGYEVVYIYMYVKWSVSSVGVIDPRIHIII